MKLVVLTEIIAPYRIPVFNALAERSETELHVIFLAETDRSMRKWHVYRDEIRFSHEVLPSRRMRLCGYNVLINRNVVDALKRADADVVVCGGYNYFASWQAQRWARRNCVPFLLWLESTANDIRPGHMVIERLKRKFFARCHGFVVPGSSAHKYAQQMGAAQGRIFVAPNAIDNALFAAHAESTRLNAEHTRQRLLLPSHYFLFVGRLVKSKGIFDLLDAYSALEPELRRDFGLVFVGDGPSRRELEILSRSIFPGTVHIAGFVHRDELASYYALADCFVLPTHTDPWGLVVNEAMACGLPVICSQSAGCVEDLVHENGRLVVRQDVPKLARAMREVAKHPELREQMSKQSRKMIQSYSPELCAAGIAQAASATRRAEFAERDMSPASLHNSILAGR